MFRFRWRCAARLTLAKRRIRSPFCTCWPPSTKICLDTAALFHVQVHGLGRLDRAVEGVVLRGTRPSPPRRWSAGWSPPAAANCRCGRTAARRSRPPRRRPRAASNPHCVGRAPFFSIDPDPWTPIPKPVPNRHGARKACQINGIDIALWMREARRGLQLFHSETLHVPIWHPPDEHDDPQQTARS